MLIGATRAEADHRLGWVLSACAHDGLGCCTASFACRLPLTAMHPMHLEQFGELTKTWTRARWGSWEVTPGQTHMFDIGDQVGSGIFWVSGPRSFWELGREGGMCLVCRGWCRHGMASMELRPAALRLLRQPDLRILQTNMLVLKACSAFHSWLADC